MTKFVRFTVLLVAVMSVLAIPSQAFAAQPTTGQAAILMTRPVPAPQLDGLAINLNNPSEQHSCRAVLDFTVWYWFNPETGLAYNGGATYNASGDCSLNMWEMKQDSSIQKNSGSWVGHDWDRCAFSADGCHQTLTIGGTTCSSCNGVWRAWTRVVWELVPGWAFVGTSNRDCIMNETGSRLVCDLTAETLV